MPQSWLTVLSAFQLLEAIGVVSKKSVKNAAGQSSNYQDAAMAPVDCSNDVEATLQDDPDDNEDESGDNDYSTGNLSDDVFYSVDKVWASAVRSFNIVLTPYSSARLSKLFIPALSISKHSFVRLGWHSKIKTME